MNGHDPDTLDNHDGRSGQDLDDSHSMNGDSMDGNLKSKSILHGTTFSSDTNDLPFAKLPETVILKDGDSYDITAYYVQKEVGNRTLRMLSYNGSVPGPFIKASQGSVITINFTNNSDIDQTIHSHGIRINNNFDGVPGVTQNAVRPGEMFSYKINFEDGGVYWYHPHTRDDYGQEMGLYGNYLVEPEEGYVSQVNREIPIIIDDILIENNKIADFYKDVTNFALLGRFGNEFLVNGEQNYTLNAKVGETIRFFVTNVSNARTYNLSIPKAKLKIVGADAGKYEREFFADNFLISPAERIVAEVYFDEPGEYSLIHSMPDGTVKLMSILVSDELVTTSYKDDFTVLNENDEDKDFFVTARNYFYSKPDKNLLLTVKIQSSVDHGQHGHKLSKENKIKLSNSDDGDRLSKIQWDDPDQNDKQNTTDSIIWKLVDRETGAESMEIPISDWTFRQGDLVKVRLTNDSKADHEMQHPIHIHGQRFVILSENGKKNSNLVWKDTVLVLPGETVDILIEMSNLGEWMSHCHISEHLHAGMMMKFRVENENGYATGDEFRKNIQTKLENEINSNEKVSSGISQTNQNKPKSFRKLNFNTKVQQNGFQAIPSQNKFRANVKQDITLSIIDTSGKAIRLDSSTKYPITITFINSDNSQSIFTYPGNTTFDDFIAPHGSKGHDNNDKHHDLEPATDGHMDHTHSFNFVRTAYAHGGVDDNDQINETPTYTYTMPVVFPEKGFYRAFVEARPEGEDETILLRFDVDVSEGFSLDNYPWSSSEKWWTLFLVSLLLLTLLSLLVHKFVKE